MHDYEIKKCIDRKLKKLVKKDKLLCIAIQKK